MSRRNQELAFLLVLISTFTFAATQSSKRPFTVADEIGLNFFGGGEGNELATPVAFSPDGKYVATDTERGRLDINRVEDSLRFYRSADIKDFLSHSEQSQPPSPLWILTPPPQKDGSVIYGWRWLPDSSGVAYLESTEDGYKRLVVADLARKTVEALTSKTENVASFDIRDRRHYVYTSTNPADLWKKKQAEGNSPAIDGTGRGLWEMLLPSDYLQLMLKYDFITGSVWSVIDGKRAEVKTDKIEMSDIELSPDGHSLLTTMRIAPPESWKTMYPPPYSPAAIDDLRAGGKVRQYVRVNLKTGTIEPLVDAPIANDAGWSTEGGPHWSSDGQAVVLPGTFLGSKEPSQPCVAVVDVSSQKGECVWTLTPCRDSNGSAAHKDCRWLRDVRFVNGDKDRVLVNYLYAGQGYIPGTTEYRRKSDGAWEQAGSEFAGLIDEVGPGDLRVRVKQAFDIPPQVVASDGSRSRVMWDPNPQLAHIELSKPRIYTWKAQDGRPWRGGLYLPPDYKPGQRYPLVLQTHGFNPDLFQPSGLFPTGFAAQALASAGMAVLQVADEGDACPMETPDEGPCMVKGYEAAVQQLDADGLIDPNNIGMVGFSRTCYYTMEALTMSTSLHIKAALITDGLMLDYVTDGLMGGLDEKMIGAPAYGPGLQTWIQRSPSFNLEKVTAALMVVGEGPASLLSMWHPYWALHYMKKPVDVVMLNSDEHTLTNPAVRMASQGGSVDWFRFWLKGEENSDPAKADQYKRWHDLRVMYSENEKKALTIQSRTN